MAKTALDTIKGWFTTSKFPTQAQFWDAFDSFRHKDDPIEITQSFQDALDNKASAEAFFGHIADKDNPHVVTKSQVGLANVDNTADNAKPISIDQQNALNLKANQNNLLDHINANNNPHVVTKSQVGLANVDNTADSEKPVSTAQATAIALKIDNSKIGAALGVAPLDSSIKVPSIYLPSYVDDVMEYADLASMPALGESGKIYIALDTLLQYRWSGSVYVKITKGEVETVNGRKGVIVLVKADVGLSAVDNTSDVDKPLSSAQNNYNTTHPVAAGGETLETVMTRGNVSTKNPTFPSGSFTTSLTVAGKNVKGVNAPVIVAATYIVQAADDIIVCNASLDITIHVPAGTASNRIITIKNIGFGLVTVSAQSGNIDDRYFNILYRWDSVTILDYSINNYAII